jgi:hypothetical protein
MDRRRKKRSRSTFGTYTHIASEDERRIAEKLSGILDPVLDLSRAEKEKRESTPATSTRKLVVGGRKAPNPLPLSFPSGLHLSRLRREQRARASQRTKCGKTRSQTGRRQKAELS